MELEDARKVAELALCVDGGCRECAANLLEELQHTFPTIDWGAFVDGRMNEEFLEGIRHVRDFGW